MNSLTNTQRTWIMAIAIIALAGIVTVSIIRDKIVEPSYNQISVTGTGRVSYVPDTARITLGVHMETKTSQEGLDQLNATMDKVIPAIEALGITRDQIGTHNLSVYPQYYYPENAPAVISGYTTDQQLSVKINIASSSPDIISKVIQAASTQGVNQIQSITFDTSNIDELKQAAVLEAITSAKARSQTIANAMGVELGDIVGWWENPIIIPGQIETTYGSGYGNEMIDKGQSGMNVPSGSAELVMEVTINYETE